MSGMHLKAVAYFVNNVLSFFLNFLKFVHAHLK